ncbi:MAG: ferrous iron transport protein B [Tissierellales bacterium]|jgi:ferrous iron transport protein B|nr:ferrous iron transport protein B [Tissierellales bacterium]MBN2827239.1 ferrous iron transport protein B [Tissierellales bacterium]
MNMDIFKIALAGNPNSGKTTLFNALTGSNHYVGNWAGVTVEKKEGRIQFAEHIMDIVDLPGIYSLSPYTLEEKISRDFILRENPDVVLNIVDATSLERSLYLTLQLIELGKPVIVALNMMDEAKKKNIELDLQNLSIALGVPVVPIVALKKEGIEKLMQEIIDAHHNKASYRPVKFNYGDEVENFVKEVELKLPKNLKEQYESRWIALKLYERDREIQNLVSPFEMESDLESPDRMANLRYKAIGDIVNGVAALEHIKYDISTDRIDKIILNPWIGLPIFGIVMWVVFFLTFSVGGYFADKVDTFFSVYLSNGISAILTFLQASDWMISLVVDGIIGGVGGVLTFVPNIAIIFIMISLLEDTGYMARAAYLMDDIMSKVGLNGKAFISMILGFGCNVPAIMATRTIENENDRMIAILINPFMSCGARFPIYVLFSSVFFPGNETAVTFSLYILGIAMAMLFAYIFRKTLFKGEKSPFIMELPPYRFPKTSDLLIHIWEKVKGYLIKAGTVIFAASVVIWVVLNFNTTGLVDITESFGATIGRFIAPIFKPLGFGTWQSALSLISGIVAKEIVVANTSIIYGLAENAGNAEVMAVLSQAFSKVSAYAFMVFVLLYTPCVGVIGVIKRETNSWKWTGFSVLYQFLVAWIMAFLFYNVGQLIF